MPKLVTTYRNLPNQAGGECWSPYNDLVKQQQILEVAPHKPPPVGQHVRMCPSHTTDGKANLRGNEGVKKSN